MAVNDKRYVIDVQGDCKEKDSLHANAVFTRHYTFGNIDNKEQDFVVALVKYIKEAKENDMEPMKITLDTKPLKFQKY